MISKKKKKTQSPKKSKRTVRRGGDKAVKKKTKKKAAKKKRTTAKKGQTETHNKSKLFQRNRQIRQEAMQEQMDGTRFLNQIQGDFEELSNLHDTVRDVKNSGSSPFKVRNVVEKAKVQHTILKTKIDTNFRRLAKVLPDLKAIELSDPNNKSPLFAMANVMKELLEKDVD